MVKALTIPTFAAHAAHGISINGAQTHAGLGLKGVFRLAPGVSLVGGEWAFEHEVFATEAVEVASVVFLM